jgi:hypothetical protein
MTTVPVFGASFVIYVPIVMIVVALVTLFNGFTRIMRLIGVESDDAGGSCISCLCSCIRPGRAVAMSEEDAERFEAGKKLVASELRLAAQAALNRSDRSSNRENPTSTPSSERNAGRSMERNSNASGGGFVRGNGNNTGAGRAGILGGEYKYSEAESNTNDDNDEVIDLQPGMEPGRHRSDKELIGQSAYKYRPTTDQNDSGVVHRGSWTAKSLLGSLKEQFNSAVAPLSAGAGAGASTGSGLSVDTSKASSAPGVIRGPTLTTTSNTSAGSSGHGLQDGVKPSWTSALPLPSGVKSMNMGSLFSRFGYTKTPEEPELGSTPGGVNSTAAGNGAAAGAPRNSASNFREMTANPMARDVELGPAKFSGTPPRQTNSNGPARKQGNFGLEETGDEPFYGGRYANL